MEEMAQYASTIKQTEESLIHKASIYIEKIWSDVVNGYYDYQQDAYKPTAGMKIGNGITNIVAYDGGYEIEDYWFNFSSEVYIEDVSTYNNYTGSLSHSFKIYDNNRNEHLASSSYTDGNSNVADIYRIWDNSDFDAKKKYRVYYRLRSSGPDYKDSDIIYLDSIEGLLTYKEASTQKTQLQKETAETEKRIARQKKIEEMKTVYENAQKVSGVEQIAEYIKKYAGDDDFNEDSYTEIARRLVNNRTVKFEKMYTASNPYAFDKNTVYYAGTLVVDQWIDRQIIASIGSFIRDDGNIIIIQTVPDIKKIGNTIQHGFLRYIGTTKIRMANGTTQERPTFNLLYHF
jgi:hypothetical protein